MVQRCVICCVLVGFDHSCIVCFCCLYAVNRLGHYYQLVPVGRTWADAVATASSYSFQGMPGHLVTIQDEAENAFVRSLLPANTDAWIDGSDGSQEGVWKFTQGTQTGTVLSYTNWRSGNPDGGLAGDAIIILQASAQWDDRSKFEGHWFVIEYECASCSPSKSC
jgi:hypothetical protein